MSTTYQQAHDDKLEHVRGLIDNGEIRTWANGYGVWHASVRDTHAHPQGVARLAILVELQDRQNNVPLPRVERAPAYLQDVAPKGHTIYREA